MLTHYSTMQQQRQRNLSVSEIITTLIHIHQSQDCNFKVYYPNDVIEQSHGEVLDPVSNTRFVEWLPYVLILRCVFLQPACLEACTGISCLDSTALAVGNNLSSHAHWVSAGLVARGRMFTTGFFSFK